MCIYSDRRKVLVNKRIFLFYVFLLSTAFILQRSTSSGICPPIYLLENSRSTSKISMLYLSLVSRSIQWTGYHSMAPRSSKLQCSGPRPNAQR